MFYHELHTLAERQLRKGGRELTLGTTTLLHEAYLSMAGRDASRFPDQHRFLAYASRAMRGLVIDYARRHYALKRGAGFQISASAGELAPAELAPADDLERLGDALESLAQADAALAEVVDLHFFGGFSLVEIARFRGVSERTVQRDWRRARLLLHHLINDPGDEGNG